MSSDLVKINAARRALQAATSVDEIKDVRDKAEAFRRYFRRRVGGIEAANQAMELVLRAERRLGELLRDRDTNLHPVSWKRLLPDGIEHIDSHRWQRTAVLPVEMFEGYIALYKDGSCEMTRAALLKLAGTWEREQREAERLAELEAQAAADEEEEEEIGPEEVCEFDREPTRKKPWDIRQGDVLEKLARVKHGTVRLAFADPPYNIGVDYGNGELADQLPKEEFINWCGRWMNGVRQVLTPDGSFWVLINDENAAEFKLALEATEFHVRQWLIWHESFGVNHPNGFNRTHRHLFWAVKNPRRFVFRPGAVKRPSDRQAKYNDRRAEKRGKTWDSVWGINPPVPRLTGTCAERLPRFPTQLPLSLLRPIIGCASYPSDLVLDPFSGSGTTGAACIELGRRFIGIEKSEPFAAMSRLRLQGLKKGN
jgi:DNA modification methylase